jgi:flagellin
MTVLNTNIGALVARNYARASDARATASMERLSSGLRINKAADDAAGLAVANKMLGQLKGINMAIRNSQDGVSLVQTAESAMNEVKNILIRMRELSVQMHNGVYTNADRINANLETAALVKEINKLATTTSFNNVALLDGSFTNTELRVGNTNAETLTFTIDAMYASTLASGLQTAQISTAAEAKTTVTLLDTAIEALSQDQAALGALQNRLDSNISNLSNASVLTEQAMGRIMDTDYARETSELAKQQILNQASTAMLAQANESKGSILSLIQ